METLPDGTKRSRRQIKGPIKFIPQEMSPEPRKAQVRGTVRMDSPQTLRRETNVAHFSCFISPGGKKKRVADFPCRTCNLRAPTEKCTAVAQSQASSWTVDWTCFSFLFSEAFSGSYLSELTVLEFSEPLPPALRRLVTFCM